MMNTIIYECDIYICILHVSMYLTQIRRRQKYLCKKEVEEEKLRKARIINTKRRLLT